MKIFVPGRICLLGEHSDWAGGYRRINAEVDKGFAVIAGTNQGVHAEVKPHPTKLIVHSTLNDGRRESFECPMERRTLLEIAERGEFFSYAAGVAHHVLTHYRVRGIEIDNYRTDLPVKKGLSSSAAICVLVARAFNRVYDLKMTVRGEMEYAYQGEITTPSRCGRLDQGCAYGNRPILMTFDGDRIDVAELTVPEDMYFVIVDLHASKDTKHILADLNRAYPFAEDDQQKAVQEYLGPINRRIVQEAVEALKAGDAARLGGLMREAQSEFDRHLQPACPSQLTAPVLHQVLDHPSLQPLIHGGKGVGSQGDGTAQLLAKDAAAQQRVVEIVEHELGMSALEMVLHSGRKVRKAIIPAAGFSPHLFPASKAIKKELFPIVDADGRAKPVIMAIVEEALAAGIEQVCIIVQPEDRERFEEFFGSPWPVKHFNRLSPEGKEYSEELLDLSRRIRLVTQDVQDGFGHAVWCARDFVDGEPFLLMLGDHVYRSDHHSPCARQVLDVYETVGQSVVGLKTTAGSDIHRFGTVAGVWDNGGRQLTVTELEEKPELDYARRHLRTEGLADDEFLTVFGMYVLESSIFEYLDEAIEHNVRESGEFRLTPCLDRVRREEGLIGVIVNGRRFDIGHPDSYREALIAFREG